MVISFEGELCTTRPLESDGPQHWLPILLIGRVSHVNEKEITVLLLGMLLTQEVHHTDAPYGACLYLSANLIHPIRLLHLLILQLHNMLFHHTPPSFSHPHELHSDSCQGRSKGQAWECYMRPMGATCLTDTPQTLRQSFVARRSPRQNEAENVAVWLIQSPLFWIPLRGVVRPLPLCPISGRQLPVMEFGWGRHWGF